MPDIVIRRRARLAVRYPLGTARGAENSTARSYGYRFRQTKRGRVPLTPDDILPLLSARSGGDEEDEARGKSRRKRGR